MEIGSEFWINDTPDKQTYAKPEWLNKWGRPISTSSGRGALTLLLENIESIVTAKTVLLPSYTCEAVIDPFIKKGYKFIFYKVSQKLEPDIKHIMSLLDKKIGLFLHIGYFGFPTNNVVKEIAAVLKSKGTMIIEDITHSLFSNFQRDESNDFYIASLRKWIGVPSGGFFAGNINIGPLVLAEHHHFIEVRKQALLLKGLYMQNAVSDLKEKYLTLFSQGEATLEEDVGAYAIDKLSSTILNDLNVIDLIQRRRTNFQYLLKSFKNIKSIKPIFGHLNYDVCPFFFPVYVENDNRNLIQKKLIENKIYCPIHWQAPEQIEDLVNTEKIYGSVLSIPCDQRYGTNDMERVVEVIQGLKLCPKRK